MNKELFTYHLCDNGGANTITLPILLGIRTQFEHEYGRYEVQRITKYKNELYIWCERLLTTTYLIDHFEKSAEGGQLTKGADFT
jgi:hypothetical protein